MADEVFISCYVHKIGDLTILTAMDMGEPEKIEDSGEILTFFFPFGKIKVHKERLVIAFEHNQDLRADVFVEVKRQSDGKLRQFGPTTFLPAIHFVCFD